MKSDMTLYMEGLRLSDHTDKQGGGKGTLAKLYDQMLGDQAWATGPIYHKLKERLREMEATNDDKVQNRSPKRCFYNQRFGR